MFLARPTNQTEARRYAAVSDLTVLEIIDVSYVPYFDPINQCMWCLSEDDTCMLTIEFVPRYEKGHVTKTLPRPVCRICCEAVSDLWRLKADSTSVYDQIERNGISSLMSINEMYVIEAYISVRCGWCQTLIKGDLYRYFPHKGCHFACYDEAIEVVNSRFRDHLARFLLPRVMLVRAAGTLYGDILNIMCAYLCALFATENNKFWLAIEPVQL